MFGGFTGLGSLAGNLLAGRSFGDSAKAGLISGFTAGTLRGVSNKMAGKTFMGDSPTPTIDPEGYQAAGMDIVPTEGSIPITSKANCNLSTGSILSIISFLSLDGLVFSTKRSNLGVIA